MSDTAPGPEQHSLDLGTECGASLDSRAMTSHEVLSSPAVLTFLSAIARSDNELRYEIVDDATELQPRRAYAGDAGLDIAIRDTLTIYPGETEYVPSNVRFFVPEGFGVLIMPRSSSFKKRVNIIPTLIDSNYTGEASTIVTNNNTYPVEVKRGARLAQALVVPYFVFANENVSLDHLGDRGARRFGSSGD